MNFWALKIQLKFSWCMSLCCTQACIVSQEGAFCLYKKMGGFSISIDEWVKKIWYTYTSRILFSRKKEWTSAICYSMRDFKIIMLSEISNTKNKMGWRCSLEVECLWVPFPVPQKKKKKRNELGIGVGLVLFLCVCVVPGMEPRGILPLSYSFSTFLFFIWNRVSLSCRELH